ncbi:MAG: hypothetical protein N3A69_06925, partial [Leptospiraceae bacterium]|nr:hypothetical protein [Leptospiraceae bacterium]
INSGIIPMTFANEADYDLVDAGDELVLENAKDQIKGASEMVIKNITKNKNLCIQTSPYIAYNCKI